MTMATRTLNNSVKEVYFKQFPVPQSDEEKGVRDMKPLYPFIISGGKNTEYYYFKHISDTSEYKFNLIPKFFCDESRYTEVFPTRIRYILKHNNDAKIFCVFDWDTVRKDGALGVAKHSAFLKHIRKEIKKGQVVVCESMPCIEYWFLLHYENSTELIKTCGRKLQKKLTPYMENLFPNTNKMLLRILKDSSFLCNPKWVIDLCKDGKLENAVSRAKNNYLKAEQKGTLDKQSYTKVFLVFTEGA